VRKREKGEARRLERVDGQGRGRERECVCEREDSANEGFSQFFLHF